MSEHIDIWKLALNKRTLHCLLAEKIQTIEELLGLKKEDILRIPDIGPKSLAEIEQALEKYVSGSLKDKTDPIPQMLQDISSKLMSVERKIHILNEIVENLVEKKLSPLIYGVQDTHTVVLEQYRLLQSIQIEKTPDGILNKINEKVPGFSTTIYDLYHKLEQK